MGLARFQHLRRRRLALSLTTRFCLPHEGMDKLEYLSRGSAFLLHDKASLKATDDLKVLTCQHVACPWLFPKYFADKWDWLQFVSEEFVQHSLQLLELPSPSQQSAKVLVDIPLEQQVWIHPDRDVAMLQPVETSGAHDWQSFLSEWNLATVALQPAGCAQGDHLLFVGHKQVEATDDDVGQFPMEVAGRVLSSNASPDEEQAAAKAAAAKQMRQALENHVAFVPASEIHEFVQDKSHCLLTGLALDFD
ncbi:hypothetical protein ATCC90586_004760 [Pythium insidiosum]|nr:hypothetical protein ATCC90586_004760 [Pythium insidiosum]